MKTGSRSTRSIKIKVTKVPGHEKSAYEIDLKIKNFKKKF